MIYASHLAPEERDSLKIANTFISAPLPDSEIYKWKLSWIQSRNQHKCNFHGYGIGLVCSKGQDGVSWYQISVAKEKNKYIFFWWLVSYSQIALCGTKFDTYCAKINFTHLHSIKTSKTEVKGKTWQKLAKVDKSWQKLAKCAKDGKNL